MEKVQVIPAERCIVKIQPGDFVYSPKMETIYRNGTPVFSERNGKFSYHYESGRTGEFVSLTSAVKDAMSKLTKCAGFWMIKEDKLFAVIMD